MRPPKVSYEDIVAAAERLHAEGKLSVRRLKEAVGGGERERLLRAIREVREQAAVAPAGGGTTAQTEAMELPESIRTCLSRLETAALGELTAARAHELNRARLAEAAAAAQHQTLIAAAESRAALLEEDLEEAETEVERLRNEIDGLSAAFEAQRLELDRERTARSYGESARNAEAEAHAKERAFLNQGLSSARAELGSAAEVRLRLESQYAAAQATTAATRAELEQVRHERGELRSRNEDLIRKLAQVEARLGVVTTDGLTPATHTESGGLPDRPRSRSRPAKKRANP